MHYRCSYKKFQILSIESKNIYFIIIKSMIKTYNTEAE